MNEVYTSVKRYPDEKLFAVRLPKEKSGIFRAGWKAEELSSFEAICKRCNEVESGSFAIVSIDCGQPQLVRFYIQKGEILLEYPRDKNESFAPDSLITLSEDEAKDHLEVLGKVVQFSLHLVD